MNMLLRKRNPEEHVAQWIERYDFDIEHRAGTSHHNADAPSRRPCPIKCSYCSRMEEKATRVLRIIVIGEVFENPELKWIQE